MNKQMETEYTRLLKRLDAATSAFKTLSFDQNDTSVNTNSAEQEQKFAAQLQTFQQLTIDEQQQKLTELSNEIKSLEITLMAFQISGYTNAELAENVQTPEPRSPSPESEAGTTESDDQNSAGDANTDEWVDDITVHYEQEAGPFANEEEDEDEPESANSDEEIAAEPITLQSTLDALPKLFEVIANIYRADRGYLNSRGGDPVNHAEKFRELYQLREQFINGLSAQRQLLLLEQIASSNKVYSSDVCMMAQNILNAYESSKAFIEEQRENTMLTQASQKTDKPEPIVTTLATTAETNSDPESARKARKLEKKWNRLTEFKTHLEAAIIKAEEIRQNIRALESLPSMNQVQKQQLKDYKIELIVVDGQFEVDQNDFKETIAAAEELLKKHTGNLSPELQSTILAMREYHSTEFNTLQTRFGQGVSTQPEPPIASPTRVEEYKTLLAKLAEVHQRGKDLYAVATSPQQGTMSAEQLELEQKEQQQIAESKLEKFQASTQSEQEAMIAEAQDEILSGLEAQQYIAASKLDFITATHMADLTALDRYVARENVEYNYLQDKINKTNIDWEQRGYQREQYAIVEEYVTEAIGSPEQYSDPNVRAHAEKILGRIESYFEKQEEIYDRTTELLDRTDQYANDQSKLKQARDNSMQKNLREIEKLKTKQENFYNLYNTTEDKNSMELIAAGVELYQARCDFVDGFTPTYIQILENIVANQESFTPERYSQAQNILNTYQEYLAYVIKKEPQILGTTYRDPQYLDPNNPRPPIQVGSMHILRDTPSADLSTQQLATTPQATAEQTSLPTTIDSMPQRLLLVEAIEKANNAYLESIPSKATVSDEKFIVLYNLREQYVNQLSETERLFLTKIAAPENSFSLDEQLQALKILTEFEESQTFLLEQKDLATIIHSEQKQAAEATPAATAPPLTTQQPIASDTDNKHKAAAGYANVKPPSKLEKACNKLTALQATLDKLIAERDALLETIKSSAQNNPDNNQNAELYTHQFNLAQKSKQLDQKIDEFKDVLNKTNERANNPQDQSTIELETRDKLAQFNSFAEKLNNVQQLLNPDRKEPPSPFQFVE